MFVYHGGEKPASPEAGAEMMNNWKAWISSLGDSLTDAGNPVGQSNTVTADSVVDNGGSNPISGYTIVSADNLADAIEIAKNCPHASHGSIEVAQIMEMMG